MSRQVPQIARNAPIHGLSTGLLGECLPETQLCSGSSEMQEGESSDEMLLVRYKESDKLFSHIMASNLSIGFLLPQGSTQIILISMHNFISKTENTCNCKPKPLFPILLL